ncbi:myosin light chain kinase, smooth muscle-like [Spea bombifrons]|uniref:myosin light chain kinase, smooth muscle-like n=1 Tax=Spea bombifrons TaxID=233779 RepID=UPI0023499DF5|nr:myosin light chain kinase, smooth muscle-like [Spea bombifrons]
MNQEEDLAKLFIGTCSYVSTEDLLKLLSIIIAVLANVLLNKDYRWSLFTKGTDYFQLVDLAYVMKSQTLTAEVFTMSYTSTLRVQLEKPLQRGRGRAGPLLEENGCGGLHQDNGKSSYTTGKGYNPPSVKGLSGCQMNNGVSITTEKGKAKDPGRTSASLNRAVKRTDHFLTVILEMRPRNGGGISVHKVKSPLHTINTAITIESKPDTQELKFKEQCSYLSVNGPLLAPPESRQLESATLQLDAGTTEPVSAIPIEAVSETKTPDREESGREGEPQKESGAPRPRRASSGAAPGTCGSPSHDPVSPKRKPHRSGDSLKLLDGVSHLEVKVGDQAELRCRIQGTPPLAASWLRNKKQVEDSQRVSVHTSNAESRLLIRQVSEDDAGCYMLCVQDQTGSTQHHTNLAVVDQPSPPLGKPITSALKATSLTLSWSGPCYDGGSAVLSYWVEVKRVGQKEEAWRLLTDCCVNTSCQVTEGLEPGGQYQFRVRAVNVHGVSEAGEESDVVIMCDAEIGEPELDGHVEYPKVSINTQDRVGDLYIQLEKLGVGKFGQVYKLQEKSTGEIRAGKFYKARLQKEIQNIKAEVELMNKLHHPRLVHCVAAFQEPGRMVMVMEYIAGGELFERIVADDFEHTEITSVRYMSQILSGVGYMHQQSIVHLDLKPENIVCISKTCTQVKIIDFGLARELVPGTSMKVLQGTPEFVAPEVIAFEPIWFTTDMWSLGVICYILLSGDSPFQGSNDMETFQNITRALWDFDEETDAVLSEMAKDFIRRLLQKNMRSRLTADQALTHPWIQHKEVSSTKTLPKERIKKFLARQKWQKTGKAMLALKRMTLLSNKSEANSPSAHTEGCESQEVFSLLQEQLQRPPFFTSTLKDQVEVVGSSARFQCNIEGFPDPEVLWFCGGSPIQESKRFEIEYEDTGSCSLVISSVTPEDSGVYTCRALNPLGEEEISARLTVHTPLAERRMSKGSDRSI